MNARAAALLVGVNALVSAALIALVHLWLVPERLPAQGRTHRVRPAGERLGPRVEKARDAVIERAFDHRRLRLGETGPCGGPRRDPAQGVRDQRIGGLGHFHRLIGPGAHGITWSGIGGACTAAGGNDLMTQCGAMA